MRCPVSQYIDGRLYHFYRQPDYKMADGREGLVFEVRGSRSARYMLTEIEPYSRYFEMTDARHQWSYDIERQAPLGRRYWVLENGLFLSAGHRDSNNMTAAEFKAALHQ